MSLHENNRSVEHFIPCNQSTKENNYDLDWQNMLAICLPPGGMKDDDLKNPQLLKDLPCCGKKKGGFIPDIRLLNPLNLPTLRLFIFSGLTGEIRPDEIACLTYLWGLKSPASTSSGFCVGVKSPLQNVILNSKF